MTSSYSMIILLRYWYWGCRGPISIVLMRGNILRNILDTTLGGHDEELSNGSLVICSQTGTKIPSSLEESLVDNSDLRMQLWLWPNNTNSQTGVAKQIKSFWYKNIRLIIHKRPFCHFPSLIDIPSVHTLCSINIIYFSPDNFILLFKLLNSVSEIQ